VRSSAPVSPSDVKGRPMPQDPTPTEPASGPAVYPGDVDVSANPVSVVEPPHEKGRLLLHTGCVTVGLALVAATAAGLIAGIIGARMWLTGTLPWATAPTTPVAPVTKPLPGDEPAAAAAAAALPSVVNIDVTGSEAGTETGGLPEGHPSVPVAGQGSGVALRAAPGGGTYIITNDHVVADATEIVVTAPGGERVKATLVGTDPDTDIAVIRVPAAVAPISLGASEKLVVGQLVVAIGSPFGLQHSVSGGVVSGLHRSLPDGFDESAAGVYPLVDVIQTDAAINPGNSGGALVDRAGRLVGINSAIWSDSGSNAGIGFAVPAKTAVRVAEELIATGKATHPYLGILGQTVDEALAAEKKLPVTQGALVVEVTKGTMAAKAGLRPDDVVVALDGEPVRSMDDLILLVRRTEVGQKVLLALYRSGRRMEITMAVGDKPAK
jgi:S1-C subfamily serine protease